MATNYFNADFFKQLENIQQKDEAILEYEQVNNMENKPVFKEYPTPGQTLFENRKAFKGLNNWGTVSILNKEWEDLLNKTFWEIRAATNEGKYELQCYQQGKLSSYSSYLKSLPKKKIRIINREGVFEV